MLGSLLAVALALRAGLSLRRARLARRPPPRGARARHLRIAKPAVAAVVLGLLAGPVSAVWLRGWAPLGTFHGWLGVVTALLFLAAGWQGLRLERGDARARSAHAWLAALAVLGACIASVAGFVLLP